MDIGAILLFMSGHRSLLMGGLGMGTNSKEMLSSNLHAMKL